MPEGQQSKRGKKKGLWAFFMTTGFFLSAFPVLAQVNTNIEGLALSDRSPVEIILYLISWFLGILALLAVILVIYGGIVWMTSNGNEEKVDQAKKILKNALIGLVIILSAWGIVLWILNVFLGATGGTSYGGNNGTGCVGCHGIPSGGSNFYVQSTNPEAGDTGIYLCYDVTVRTSLNVDKTTVTPDNFYLQVLGGSPSGATCVTNNQCGSSLCAGGTCQGNTVAGVIGFGPGDSTRYFNLVPDADLEQFTSYEAVVVGGSSGILSEDPTSEDSIDDRTAMDTSYVWSYTTGGETDTIPPTVEVTANSPFPADGTLDVCLNTVVNFDFSESMRISTFNDDTSFVLDGAGVTAAPVAPDWVEPRELRNWNFGGAFDFAQARPKTALESYSLYSPRLYGGDPTDNFAGSLQDSCGNPLDGDADVVSEGDPVDNFLGHLPGDPEVPITWETGETTECTPVVDGFAPGADFYGEYSGLADGASCTTNSECGSGLCTGGTCVGFGPTTLNIIGQNLAPHPEIQLEGSIVWAGESFNTCFSPEHLGNVVTNTAVGDVCMYDDEQSITEIAMRTPVGSKDTPIRVTVAEETSEPSASILDVQSPYIAFVDPDNGSVGQYVTISGDNFGEITGTVLMRSADGVRQSSVDLPASCGPVWSDDEIVAIVPETYIDSITGLEEDWVSGDIAYFQVINATNGRNSDLQMFEFNEIVRPNLCSIVPNCAENAPQGFTATGENFGDTEGSSYVNFAIDDDTGYSASVGSWSDIAITGNTHSSMVQDDYWVTVYDGDTELNSNGRGYDIPCSLGPNVVNISQCNQAEGIYPVPSPRPNEDEACLNANIGVLFDQPMDTSTFNGSTVYLEQYNSGGVFDPAYTPLPVSGYFQTTTWSYIYDSETLYGFQYNVSQTSVDADQDSVADGPTSLYLQPDTWYILTITTGVTNSTGVNMASTYTMRFKADDTTELCVIDTIDVAPASSIQNAYWNPIIMDINRQNYTGTPYDAACNLLDADSYSWDWTIDDTNIGNFGVGPGPTSSENVYVAGNTITNVGETDVNAAVELVNDDASFEVDFGFCTTDDDCSSCSGSVCSNTGRCTPVVNNINPINGDHGTWVSVNGCMFGDSKGELFWNNGSDTIHADTAWPDAAQCGDTWTPTQIIAEIPDEYDGDGDDVPETALPEEAYNVEVVTRYGDAVEPAGTLFTVNGIERPGICQISPNTAREGDEVVVQGQALGTNEGFASFQDDQDVLPPAGLDRLSASADDTFWTASEIESEVATGASPPPTNGFLAIIDGGDEQCVIADACTNTLEFTPACYRDSDCGTGCCGNSGACAPASACSGCQTDADCVDNGQCPGSTCNSGQCTPVINELVPEQGPNGGPTTIAGCYFGSYGSGSGVTFENIPATLLCGSNGWTDQSIVAEVPTTGLPIGTIADLEVSTANSFSVLKENAFEIIANCATGVPVPASGVPVLCNLVPSTGGTPTPSIPGTEVRFEGDRFVSGQTVDMFSPNVPGTNFTFLNSGKSLSTLDAGALSGFATAVVDSCPSNGQFFGVTCSTAAECPADAYCINGYCTSNPNGCLTDADCGDGNACVYDAAISGNTCVPRPTFEDSIPNNGATGICPNSQFQVTMSQSMVGINNIYFDELQPDATGNLVSVTTIPATTYGTPTTDANGNYIYTLTPSTPFPDPTSTYHLVVPSEVDGLVTEVRADAYGLTLVDNTETIEFSILPNNCLPTSISLLNNENNSPFFTFSSPGQTTDFTATMLSNDSQPLAPTPLIGWDFTWAPYYNENACNNIAWVDLTAAEEAVDGPAATAETQTVMSGTENTLIETLTVSANPTATSTWTGTIGPVSAALGTFFCDPTEMWEYNDDPSHSSYISHAFPQHFRVLYCDSATLPTLSPPAIVEGSVNDDWFLQYLFVDAASQQDAFGVRVYDNAASLSPLEWYNQNVPQPNSPSEMTIDGYQAVRDGLSYYISASNIIDGQDSNSNNLDDIYNNIYLFTFNDAPGVLNIANQVLENLIFNTNPSISYAACEGSQKEKLVRDTKRISDIGSIVNQSNAYFDEHGDFPQPQSDSFGSFVSAITTSVWPSWQGALGNVLEQTLPTDPYNFFYASDDPDPWNAGDEPWVYGGSAAVQDCEYDSGNNVYYDEDGSCWDPVNNNFFCPNNSSTYMYIRNPLTPNFAAIYGRMEYTSSTTEVFATSGSTLYDPCTSAGLTNAECSCYNYGLISQPTSSGPWVPVP